jgi:hypothetical protein
MQLALLLRTIQVVALLACGVATVVSSRVDVSFAARGSTEAQATLNRQPHLLERALAELKPSEQGRTHLYFVGFAGYGAEAVFKREVLAVRQLFDERFHTKGRSLGLINHHTTADEVPLATITNLESVLRHLGRFMDLDRDMLFLFLTSHGQEGVLTVHMPGLMLRQLRPVDLKRILDRSGIRKRVVVISSCHSGSFIPMLADTNTLVIAAARADRSSFGCEDRREWTYFGDAYFNRALRQEISFRRAFVRAKQLIAGWEVENRLIPSLPQIAGGEALAEAK